MGQAQLRRLRIAPSGADLFADPVAGFIYPAFEGLEVTADLKPYERKFQSSDHDHFAQSIGEKESGLKFSTEMRGFGGSPAGAGSAVIATSGENGLLLKSCFGAEQLDTGSVAASATTASLIKVASTSLFTVGGFVGCVDPATSLLHVRQIRAKTSTDLTLCRALPFTPALASVVYASASYAKAISGHQHLWFDGEGYDSTAAAGWRRYIRGCLGNVGFKNLSANGKAMLEFDFQGVDWSDAGQGSSQGAPAYPSNLPAAGGFIRSTRVLLGATELIVSDVGFELGNDVQPKPSTSAANGVASFQVVDSKMLLTFRVARSDYETATLHAAWKAATKKDVLIEMTQGGPGNSFALAAPVTQIVACKPSVQNGLDYVDVTLSILASGITGVAAATLGVL